MERKFCEHCGSAMESDDIFCPSCGQRISDTDTNTEENDTLIEPDEPEAIEISQIYDEPEETEISQIHQSPETPEVSRTYQEPQAPETFQTHQEPQTPEVSRVYQAPQPPGPSQTYQAPQVPGISQPSQPSSIQQTISANPFKQFSSNMGPAQVSKRTSNRGMIIGGAIAIIILAAIIASIMLFFK